MVTQNTITVVANVRDGQLAVLRNLLEEIRADVAGNTIIPFSKLDTVRFVILA